MLGVCLCLTRSDWLTCESQWIDDVSKGSLALSLGSQIITKLDGPALDALPVQSTPSKGGTYSKTYGLIASPKAAFIGRLFQAITRPPRSAVSC